jgi:hypothetical protein
MHVDAITVYRCETCKRIVADVEILKLGKCPYCDGDHFRGTSPTKWEVVKLFVRLLFFKKG